MIAGRTRAWLSLILVGTTAHAGVNDILDGCEAVESEDDSYYEYLADVCPEAIVAIERHPLAESLPGDWRQALTVRTARQFAALEDWYAAGRNTGPTIDPAALDTIVEGLNNPSRVDSEKGPFRRFLDWLDEVFGGDDEEAPGLFDEWLADVKVPQSALEYAFYIISGLIILSAIGVIVMELRAARQAGRGATNGQVAPRNGPAGGTARPATLADLERAAVEDKPAILLALIRGQLERLALLSYRAADTHRELAAAAAGLPEDQGEVVITVAGSAERARYAAAPPGRDEIDSLVESGKALLRRLGGRT